MFCTQLKRVDLAVHCGKNVLPYALFLNCSPAKFKEVKNCSDMVAGRTNKKKETKGCFKTYASKKHCLTHEYLLSGPVPSIIIRVVGYFSKPIGKYFLTNFCEEKVKYNADT